MTALTDGKGPGYCYSLRRSDRRGSRGASSTTSQIRGPRAAKISERRQLHRLFTTCRLWVIFDQFSRSCLADNIRFAPKADLRRRRQKTTASYNDVPCLAVVPCFLPCTCLSARQTARQNPFHHSAHGGPLCVPFLVACCDTLSAFIPIFSDKPRTKAPRPSRVLS